MALNKLENQIKEKLNSREIQPSAQAWDRLDAMLSVAEEKKTKRPFGFLFIAASITILLAVGMFFFTHKSTVIQTENNVVGTEVKKDSVQKEENKLQIPTISKEEVVVSSENKSSTINNQPQFIKSSKEEVSIINQKTPSNQNQINKDKAIEYQITQHIAQKDLPTINVDKEIILVGNKNVKSDEALLADLDKAAKQSTNKKASVKIDAKSLLSQVDGEVEYTFREKILNKINKNYKEVKVALSNRNKE